MLEVIWIKSYVVISFYFMKLVIKYYNVN